MKTKTCNSSTKLNRLVPNMQNSKKRLQMLEKKNSRKLKLLKVNRKFTISHVISAKERYKQFQEQQEKARKEEEEEQAKKKKKKRTKKKTECNDHGRYHN
jgi:septal ring factor EnvC (AmiA/AmiB activator)